MKFEKYLPTSHPEYPFFRNGCHCLSGLFSGLGEEIGCRGLFVPELAKVTSYTKFSLISGAVWAAWHAPVFLFSDYNNPGAPLWFDLFYSHGHRDEFCL